MSNVNLQRDENKINRTFKGDKPQLEIIRSILIENRVVTEKDVEPYGIGRDSFRATVSRLNKTMSIEADHIEREQKPFTKGKNVLRYRI